MAVETPPDDAIVNQDQSLFEHFADTEVSVFGMTGTLAELGDMCPVPPEQRSPEAMDRFAAKVLEASGVEIPDIFRPASEDQTPAPVERSSIAPPKESNVTEKIEAEVSPLLRARRVELSQLERPQEFRADSTLDTAVIPGIQTIQIRDAEIRQFESEVVAETEIEAITTEPIKPTPLEKIPKMEKLVPESTLNTLSNAETLDDSEMTLVKLHEDVETVSAPDVKMSPGLPLLEETSAVEADYLPDVARVQFVESEVEIGVAEPSSPLTVADETQAPFSAAFLEEISEPIRTMEPAPRQVVAELAQEVIEILPLTLPEAAQQQMGLFLELASPTELIEAETLGLAIKNAADRLNELVTVEELGSAEALEAEALLIELYDELLNHLGIEVDEKLREAFIANIKSSEYVRLSENQIELFDEGTHERKLLGSYLQNVTAPALTPHTRLGRFILNIMATA